MSALVLVTSALFGLAIGSFLNVVITRLPAGSSLVRPRSRCPRCAHELSWFENVPVLSYVTLRGRCRSCREPIPVRYLLVELVTAGLFVALAAKFSPGLALLAYWLLAAGLLALAVIDLEHLRLPVRLVWPLLGAMVVLLAGATLSTHRWHALVIGIAAGAGWWLLFLVIHLSSPRHLGFGDVRLAPVLGLSLGWLNLASVLIGFFAANLFGLLVGLVLIAAKRIDQSTPIPYGLFLAVGTGVGIFLTPSLLALAGALR